MTKWKLYLEIIALIFLLVLLNPRTWAAGVQGLTYETYRGTGASPSRDPLTYPTVLSTGVSANINYPTGSFGSNLLGSGRIDQVMVKWTGYVNIASGGTYTFGGSADDGIHVTVSNTVVIDSWVDSGNGFRTGTPITLTQGVHPITVWYYENGGGQAIVFQWLVNGSWQVVPTTVFATESSYWTPAEPVLCCGGSSNSFSMNSAHSSAIQAFTGRTSNDSQISIEQIGNSNVITVNQTGTNQNYLDYSGNGSFNTVTVTQSGNSSTVANYIELGVIGNSNTVNLTQTSTGGTKSIFATVSDNNNSLTIQQRDSGSHYANVTVSGGNKTVDITQQGSAPHMANVNLSGNNTGLNLTQSGSTQQFYSITHSCSTAGGCGTITVQQGQ